MKLCCRKVHGFLAGILFLLASSLSSGCAHRPFPSEDIRASLGQIGVSVECKGGGHLYVPAAGRGEGAAKGAGTVVSSTLSGGGSANDWLGALLRVGVIVIGAPVGAIVGAVKAMPAEEAKTADSLINRKLEGKAVSEKFKRYLLTYAVEKKVHAIVPLEGYSSESPASNYKDNGIDTILDIRVNRIGLISEKWGSQPPLGIMVESDARLIRVKDGEELFRKGFMQIGKPHGSSEWYANDAQLLLLSAEEECLRQAESIVDTLFFKH